MRSEVIASTSSWPRGLLRCDIWDWQKKVRQENYLISSGNFQVQRSRLERWTIDKNKHDWHEWISNKKWWVILVLPNKDVVKWLDQRCEERKEVLIVCICSWYCVRCISIYGKFTRRMMRWNMMKGGSLWGHVVMLCCERCRCCTVDAPIMFGFVMSVCERYNETNICFF